MNKRFDVEKTVNFVYALGAVFPLTLQAQMLEDVVVSASRTEQRIFDAPAAIQSVGRDAIQRAGPQVNLSESLTRVPGLTILDRQNYAQDLQISIRGFGARSAFGIRGIRLLIDGIPASTPDGQGQGSSISLPSTERIEVLRGPMALLYGNSSGGVIQAFTRSAPAKAEIGYQYFLGSNGLRRADYQFGDTLDKVGVIANYSTMTIDGYRLNSAADRKQLNGRVIVALKDNLKLNLVFNQFDMPLALDPLGLTRTQLQADPAGAGTNAVETKTRKLVLQNQLGTSATYSLDGKQSLTLRSFYGTRKNTQYLASKTWVGLDRAYYGLGMQYNAHSVWFDLPVQWAAGYEFDQSREYRQSGAAVLGQKSGALTRSEDNQSQSSDLFVQANASVAESWSIFAGLRSSNLRFVSDDYFVTATNPDGSGNVAYRALSPVLGLTYHASSRLNMYANFGRGFETPTLAEMAYQSSTSGSPSLRGQFNPAINASRSEHAELGAKWNQSSDTRVDLAFYQINTTDEIVVLRSNLGQSAYKNAPGTSRSGWELAGSTRFTPHLAFSASASKIDAHYSQIFTSDTTVVTPGKQLPGIPQSFLFSELAWSSNPTKATLGGGYRFGVEIVHVGRIYATDTNIEFAEERTVLNLSASKQWRIGGGGLTALARINNLGDERYVGSVIVNQSAQQFYEPGLPQNWSIGLTMTLPL